MRAGHIVTLITSLKTTIEVMEAEITCLKDNDKICNCKERYEESYSHGHHIAGLLQGVVGLRPRVTAVVKPGANLLSVTSNTLPPPHTCTIIISGTNDVAAGEHTTLLQHLEQRIAVKLSSSTVIVSTQSHRHDLAADHPVNGHTMRGNGFTDELRAKHKNLKDVNLNHIIRRLLTSHGMHIRMAGKCLFFKLIIEALLRINNSVCNSSSAIMESPADRPPSNHRIFGGCGATSWSQVIF
ncbi:hypothetical protein J6590_083886 [Homalodisca vitripennis]|nr:hypothetical protein J6590_083886 [Homalodisca vitripennis]